MAGKNEQTSVKTLEDVIQVLENLAQHQLEHEKNIEEFKEKNAKLKKEGEDFFKIVKFLLIP